MSIIAKIMEPFLTADVQESMAQANAILDKLLRLISSLEHAYHIDQEQLQIAKAHFYTGKTLLLNAFPKPVQLA